MPCRKLQEVRQTDSINLENTKPGGRCTETKATHIDCLLLESSIKDQGYFPRSPGLSLASASAWQYFSYDFHTVIGMGEGFQVSPLPFFEFSWEFSDGRNFKETILIQVLKHLFNTPWTWSVLPNTSAPPALPMARIRSQKVWGHEDSTLKEAASQPENPAWAAYNCIQRIRSAVSFSEMYPGQRASLVYVKGSTFSN